MSKTKHCRWCDQTKPISDFYVHPRMKDGHLNKCVACVCAYARRHNAKHPLRRVWLHMRDRCTKPRHRFWHRYGGRGISVCDRWRSFDHFAQDMGASYCKGLTLDRIDNDGNYEPGNCRWVDGKTNVRNSSTTHQVTAFGKTQCIVEWAEETGITASAIEARLNRLGWSSERAVSTPVQRTARWP